ncbi:hypothetical protein S-CBP3_0009 [Synechococcus phage S-CBP3]|uniref:Uncharacterized protein n=1 Tax=Synechococcus phage S-CBP3 TaxID=756276 RepID=A0A096VKI4_9CAUD|nr:hypothetical protein S-CBP3_0009 [Synechococcus phage S-CBP3]AGK86566.1 hypothetical protein S-CBP3_0009 [Synechococcus phage S-CBP3]
MNYKNLHSIMYDLSVMEEKILLLISYLVVGSVIRPKVVVIGSRG